MRQGLLVAPHEFSIREIEPPTPGPDQVLIEIQRAGICGSDLHIYHGENPVIHPPVVMGHEFCGTVAAGATGAGLRAGQFVTVQPDVPCGKCVYCLAGQTNLCPDMRFIGSIGFDGAFGEYLIAPASSVIPLPGHLEPQDGAMVEPVAVALHALSRVPAVAGAGVLVLGAGTIGNLTAQAARLDGARRVGITDVLDGRLQLARDVGVDAAFNPGNGDFASWVRAEFGPAGPDVAFDCVAAPATLQQALKAVRRGGVAVLVGVPRGDLPVPAVDMLLGESTLVGTYCYVREDFDKAVRWVADGRIQTRPLISRTYGLGRLPEAFRYAADRSGGAVKVHVDPQHG